MAVNVETIKCSFCRQTSVLTMTDEEWAAVQSGLPIQEALPHWSAGQREMLQTGIHQTCWDQIFPKCVRCNEVVEGEEDGARDPDTGRWAHFSCPGVDEPL